MPLALLLVGVTTRALGCSIVVQPVAEQPFAEVTVTQYSPATRPVADDVVPPPVQLYVYGSVPPETTTVRVPLEPPLQVTAVLDNCTETGVGAVIVTVALSTQTPSP